MPYRSGFKKAFKPKPKQTISEWADSYRVLSKESASEAGKWKTSRAEYQRGIMDAMSDSKIHTVVVMSSAQVGKTSILENIVGFYAHYEPAPILILQPTLEMAQAFSKDRLEPMFRDTPVLRGIFSNQAKKSNSTILHKKFNGGHITMAGANSPASLASRPIKILLADEVDRYPLSAGEEGDPVNLAKKRTTTFWDKKIFLCSTPTIKGQSRIEFAYENSDKRKFYVPCPECNHKQVLIWDNVKWEKNRPETAKYVCENCGSLLSDAKRWEMVSKGEWIAEKPTNGIAGFHLNELYSPWVRLEDMVLNFLEASKNPQLLKTFINTSLGETWEEESEKVDYTGLLKRKENYDDIVPNGVILLTAGVDIQDDRIECEVVGWGYDYESWSIDYIVIDGDPANNETWEKLEEVLFRDYNGHKITATAIDTGGHRTKFVYQFVAKHRTKNIFAIKGSSILNAPIVNIRPNRNNEYSVPLYMVGVNSAKDVVMGYLTIEEEGSGYCHFPNYEKYDEEYFKQLTAEKRETTGKWVKTRHRNEALDCRVYAYASLEILGGLQGGINWDYLANFRRKKRRKPQPKANNNEIEIF